MNTLLASLFGVTVYSIVALIALSGAVLALLARFDPRMPKSLSSVIAGVLVCISVWFFSAAHYDRQSTIRNLRGQVAAMERIAAAHELISTQANTNLLKRLEQIDNLEKLVQDYELQLEKGEVTACPADPVYHDRMRALQFPKAS